MTHPLLSLFFCEVGPDQKKKKFFFFCFVFIIFSSLKNRYFFLPPYLAEIFFPYTCFWRPKMLQYSPVSLNEAKICIFLKIFYPFNSPLTNEGVNSFSLYWWLVLYQDSSQRGLPKSLGEWPHFLEVYIFLLEAVIFCILSLAWQFVGENKALAPKSTFVSTHCARHQQSIFATSFHKSDDSFFLFRLLLLCRSEKFMQTDYLWILHLHLPRPCANTRACSTCACSTC